MQVSNNFGDENPGALAGVLVHPTAEVDQLASIGAGTRIWHHAQIRAHAKIGRNCVLGKNTYVDLHVEIGDNCKLQNNVNVYRGSKIEDGVFLGPGVLLLNDKYPRAILPDGRLKGVEDWDILGIVVHHGAAVGGGAVVLDGVSVGRWASVGVGAVVTRNVPEHALVYGNPAEIHGFVDQRGVPMKFAGWRGDRAVFSASDGFELEVLEHLVPEHFFA